MGSWVCYGLSADIDSRPIPIILILTMAPYPPYPTCMLADMIKHASDRLKLRKTLQSQRQVHKSVSRPAVHFNWQLEGVT